MPRTTRPRRAMPAARPITSGELASARTDLVLRQLFVVFTGLRDRFFAALAEAGYPDLNMQHSLLLRNLPFEGTTMADLVRRAGVSRQAIAKIARDLERRGFLVVEENPADARGVRLRFSKEGLVLARAIVATAKVAEDEVARLLGPTDMTRFRKALSKLQAGVANPESRSVRASARAAKRTAR